MWKSGNELQQNTSTTIAPAGGSGESMRLAIKKNRATIQALSELLEARRRVELSEVVSQMEEITFSLLRLFASGMSDSPSHLQLSKEEQTTANEDMQISLLYHIPRFCMGRVPDSATNSLNLVQDTELIRGRRRLSVAHQPFSLTENHLVTLGPQRHLHKCNLGF